jgi:hypothetical protein
MRKTAMIVVGMGTILAFFGGALAARSSRSQPETGPARYFRNAFINLLNPFFYSAIKQDGMTACAEIPRLSVGLRSG